MSVLIVIDQPPYGRWSGRESLDMALSLAAFDQPVSVLFRDAGVNWLRQGQNPASLIQKGADKNVAAAPIFGIEELLVEREAVERFGLVNAAMLPGTTQVDCGPDLLANYRHVVCV